MNAGSPCSVGGRGFKVHSFHASQALCKEWEICLLDDQPLLIVVCFSLQQQQIYQILMNKGKLME